MKEETDPEKKRPVINLSIVAGRRPDLLRKTLHSFSDRAFFLCDVGRVRVNIDPIFGTEKDEIDTADCVRDFFPQATVRIPKKPSFTTAVKWLWSEIPDGPFLHIEDDWICLEDVPINEIVRLLDVTTTMVTLTASNHRTPETTRERTRQKRHRFCGVIYKRETVPEFGTSPFLALGDFARDVSSLLDVAYDPEKQMRDNYNPALMSYLKKKRCMFHASLKGSPLIQDIGRDWRQERNISKTVKKGVSYWIKNK